MTDKKASSEEEKAGLVEMLGMGKATISIDGEKYECRSPEIGDMAQFAITIQDELMESVHKKAERILDTLMGRGVSEDACTAKYMEVIEKGALDEWKLIRKYNSLDGTRFLFLACATDNHPELDEKAVKKMITEKNWRQIRRRLNLLKGPASSKNAESGENPDQ